MKIAESRTFMHDVKVFTPVDGGHEVELLQTTFNYLDTNVVETFDLKTRDGTTAFLEAAVVKFGNLTDEQRQPVAYSDDIRRNLFGLQHVRQAVITHFFDAVSKVSEGN